MWLAGIIMAALVFCGYLIQWSEKKKESKRCARMTPEERAREDELKLAEKALEREKQMEILIQMLFI